MSDCLIVFAKEPTAVRVKTRLKKILSADKRRKLYTVFLKDTARTCAAVKAFLQTNDGSAKGSPEMILAYESGKKDPVTLKKIFKGYRFLRQEGKGLGERMYNAFRFCRERGSRRAVIIGTDSPGLPPEYIAQAFKKISNRRVVLGPCPDGGYYLIGLSDPCFGLFRGIKWSSGSVLSGTLERAGILGKKVHLLPRWHDIDTPEALSLLMERFV